MPMVATMMPRQPMMRAFHFEPDPRRMIMSRPMRARANMSAELMLPASWASTGARKVRPMMATVPPMKEPIAVRLSASLALPCFASG